MNSILPPPLPDYSVALGKLVDTHLSSHTIVLPRNGPLGTARSERTGIRRRACLRVSVLGRVARAAYGCTVATFLHGGQEDGANRAGNRIPFRGLSCFLASSEGSEGIGMTLDIHGKRPQKIDGRIATVLVHHHLRYNHFLSIAEKSPIPKVQDKIGKHGVVQHCTYLRQINI